MTKNKKELIALLDEFQLAVKMHNQSKPIFEDGAELSLQNFIRWLNHGHVY